MSAVERYSSALEDEVRAGGRVPVVVVVGAHDYEELYGELALLFSVTLTTPSEVPDKFQYKGISVFKSHTHTHGFWFGGQPT